MLKKIQVMCLLCLSMFMVSSTAYGESTTSDVSLTGGTLSMQTNSIVFPAEVIDPSVQKSVGSTVYNVISDPSGTGEGWKLSLLAGDFVSNDIPDKSNSVAGSTLNISFPSSYLQIVTGNIYRDGIKGQLEDPTFGPLHLVQSVYLGNGPVLIASAAPGFGMGQYIHEMAMNLEIPSTGKIAKLSDENTSKLKVGDDIGLAAGSYRATFTYTLSSGI